MTVSEGWKTIWQEGNRASQVMKIATGDKLRVEASVIAKSHHASRLKALILQHISMSGDQPTQWQKMIHSPVGRHVNPFLTIGRKDDTP